MGLVDTLRGNTRRSMTGSRSKGEDMALTTCITCIASCFPHRCVDGDQWEVAGSGRGGRTALPVRQDGVEDAPVDDRLVVGQARGRHHRLEVVPPVYVASHAVRVLRGRREAGLRLDARDLVCARAVEGEKIR